MYDYYDALQCTAKAMATAMAAARVYIFIFIGRKSVFVISYYHNNYFVNFFHKN